MHVVELGEAFFLFDYDKDKKITTRELGAVIRSVGLNPTQSELNEMIKEVETTGEGDVQPSIRSLHCVSASHHVLASHRVLASHHVSTSRRVLASHRVSTSRRVSTSLHVLASHRV